LAPALSKRLFLKYTIVAETWRGNAAKDSVAAAGLPGVETAVGLAGLYRLRPNIIGNGEFIVEES